MNEKVQDLRGLSALLIGNKAERPGKQLQRTAAFSLWTQIPHWLSGPGADPALRTKKQGVRGKPLKSRRPNGRWKRNQGALVREGNTTHSAMRNIIWPTAASKEMFAS